MATTPLKTASRALSLATVMVATFAVWLLTTQDSTREQSAVATSPTNVSLPSNTKTPPTNQSHAPTSASSKRTRPTESRTADTDSRPRVLDESYFRQDRDKPAPSESAVSETRTQPPHQSQRTQARIQPDLGKRSSRTDALLVADVEDELNSPAETSQRPAASINPDRRPAAVFRPAGSAPEFDTTRIDAQLTALQRKLDQLAQAQNDQKVSDQQRTTELLQQIQQQKQAEQLERLLQQLQDAQQKANDPSKQGDAAKLLDAARLLEVVKTLESKAAPAKTDAPAEAADEPEPSDPSKPGAMRAELRDGSRDRFEFIDFHDADISEALAMLGQLSGMNILIGRGVSGRVPAANLQNVTAEQALEAITKSLGFVYERDQDFVYVWTATDAAARKQAARKTMSKVYRPRYVSVRELQALVTPMLSKPGGLIAMTQPAETGLEESKTKVGGDSLAQTDALLVIDYPDVIAQVDRVVADIDAPPAQVVIEAMILSVKLDDSMKLGVNFALLNRNEKQLVTTGNGSQINSNVGFNDNSLMPIAGDFLATTAGLKYGFINGDLAGFVEALETLAETSVVASPSVRVLNKQRAELIIGQRLGYKTTTFNGTQSIENINFLEVGTKLVLRPFVAEDGLVRMEIHPERSDGTISDAGLPNSRTTEVTSNVMVRDGSTIVIGGLIEEQANQSQSRVPGLGALPVVGNLFKNKSNDATRTELIVLITPRIIRDPEAESEGDWSRTENERRHQEYRDKLSPINRHNLARIEYERAARYFEEGDASRAKWHIDESLRHNRLDRDALRLRDQIVAALDDKNWFKKLRRKPPTQYHNVPSPLVVPPPGATFEPAIPEPEVTPPKFETPTPPAPESSSRKPPNSAPRAAVASSRRVSRS